MAIICSSIELQSCRVVVAGSGKSLTKQKRFVWDEMVFSFFVENLVVITISYQSFAMSKDHSNIRCVWSSSSTNLEMAL